MAYYKSKLADEKIAYFSLNKKLAGYPRRRGLRVATVAKKRCEGNKLEKAGRSRIFALNYRRNHAVLSPSLELLEETILDAFLRRQATSDCLRQEQPLFVSSFSIETVGLYHPLKWCKSSESPVRNLVSLDLAVSDYVC